MQFTIELFEHLAKSVPPLVPPDIAARLKHAAEHVHSEPNTTAEQVEDTMIAFGYEVWPYNQAYREFLHLYESKLGEHFFLPKLSASLQERYREFKMYGGGLRDLHSGRPAEFFTGNERGDLCVALIELKHELRTYTDRQIATTERKKYLARVQEFALILKDIKERLQELNELAAREQDHPALAAEIRAQIRHFEYGLCYLGPEIDYAAVCEAPDYFRGRKHELNRLRGIREPVEIDFYASLA